MYTFCLRRTSVSWDEMYVMRPSKKNAIAKCASYATREKWFAQGLTARKSMTKVLKRICVCWENLRLRPTKRAKTPISKIMTKPERSDGKRIAKIFKPSASIKGTSVYT